MTSPDVSCGDVLYALLYALELGGRALIRPVISPLHTLVSACNPWSIDATEIEEDLTEFRSLDQRLLDITRAQNTTATRLLESSDNWTTWERFKKRDPQRVQDLAYLDTYVWIIKSCKHASFTFEVVRGVKAAHSRILHDLYNLLVILASVDSTRYVYEIDGCSLRTLIERQQVHYQEARQRN